MRLNIINHKGLKIINDVYASPQSMGSNKRIEGDIGRQELLLFWRYVEQEISEKAFDVRVYRINGIIML